MAKPELKNMTRRRPAETSAAGGGIALVIGRLLGIDDPDLLAGLGLAVALIPAVVSFVVSNGGLRGVWRLIRDGRDPETVIEFDPEA